MQMMVEPQETKYLPKHMKEPATEATRAELRRLAEELPDGIVLSVDPWEVVSDGQEDG
jgi:hypothetical protein